MRHGMKKIIAGLSLSVLTMMQCTVGVLADTGSMWGSGTYISDDENQSSASTESGTLYGEKTESDNTSDAAEDNETNKLTETDVELAELDEATADDAKKIFALDAKLDIPEIGVAGFYTSDEDMMAIRRIIDADKLIAKKSDIPNAESKDAYSHSTSYFYNQLNTSERALWSNLSSACQSLMNSSTNLTSQYMDYVSYSSSIDSTRLNQIIQLFYYSNPQYFFIMNAYRYSSSYVYLMIDSDFQTASVRQSTYSSLQTVTNSWMTEINKQTTDLAKEQLIYTKLCNTITYNSYDHHQSIVGALLENRCLCTGYAMAMTYFCNAAGLDCITIVSTNNAWNRVKLNGYWYEIDVTMMDQGSYIDTKWCNKSEATFRSQDLTYDSARLSHTINDTIKAAYYNNITLPSCTRDDPSSASFRPTVVSAVNGAVTLSWTAVSGATNYAVYTYVNGTYNCVGYTTGTKYTVTGLTNGIKYGFLVRYYKNGAWSSYSTADIVYATPTYSVKPSITSATAGNGSVALKWSAVSSATKYAVYTYINGTYTCVATTTGTSYTVTGLTNGIKYGFLVRAYVNNAWSSFASTDIVYATPKYVAKPSITSATAGNNCVALKWSAVSGATKYAVYTYINGTYSCAATTTGTSYTVRGLTNGVKYGFLIRAYLNNTWTGYSTADIVYATPKYVAKPSITSAVAGDSCVTLKWSSVSGASKYAIYAYVNGSFKCVGTTTSTSHTVNKLTNGVKYGFLVRAYVNKAWTGYSSTDIVYATPKYIAKPKITSATAGNTKVTLKWSAVSGASKYAVYTYVNGTYDLVSTISGTSYTVSNLVNGVKYGFLVRAYVNGAWSSYTSSDIVYATPKDAPKPKILSTSSGNKCVTLNWSAVSGASKYAIYTYINGTYTCVATTTGTSYTVTGLANGVNYGFLVRSYLSGVWSSFTTSDIVYATPKATSNPQITSISVGNGSATLRWTAVADATQYIVYTYVNGAYTIAGTTTATTYTVYDLASIKYGFLVRAYVNGAWTNYSTSDIVYATPY